MILRGRKEIISTLLYKMRSLTNEELKMLAKARKEDDYENM